MTPVRLSLQAGAIVRCEVWWPKGQPKSVSRKYRILDGAGEVFYEYEGRLDGLIAPSGAVAPILRLFL
ncbi:MAG: hypothetical protein AAF628_29835 [Planctomycetota bacterium]